MKNLQGQRFGRLLAIEFSSLQSGRALWMCICDCGKNAIVNEHNLKSGHTSSCGCLHSERFSRLTHGMSKTQTYRSWAKMMERCYNAANIEFPRYGARGIVVCEKWKKFDGFFSDMGERPKGKTIDRKDNNGNYDPANCRWATLTEQSRNRRNNRMVTLNGITKPLVQWAEDLGVRYGKVRNRLFAGWAIEDALEIKP